MDKKCDNEKNQTSSALRSGIEEREEFRGQTMRRYLIYIISLKYLLIYLILMMIYFTKQYA